MGNMWVRTICLRFLCALRFKRAKFPNASREGPAFARGYGMAGAKAAKARMDWGPDDFPWRPSRPLREENHLGSACIRRRQGYGV